MEDRREQQHDRPHPHRVHRQVRGLPALDHRERPAPADEAEQQPRRPCEVDQQHDVLAERRHVVRGGAVLGDAAGHGEQHQRVDDQRAGDQGELHEVDGAARRERVAGRHRVEQQPEHHGEQQVEHDQGVPVDVDAAAVPADGDQERQQRHGEQRREQPGEHRGDVLDDALLGLDEPPGDDDRGHAAARHHPLPDQHVGVDPDGVERPAEERDEHSPAEGDEHEVDEPFAAEPDEVHPPPGRAQVVGDVGEPDHEPQRDRQVRGGERDRLGLVVDRVDVRTDRAQHEQRGQNAVHLDARLPPPGEEPGEPGQHEQGKVGGVEPVVVLEALPEQLGQLDRDRGAGRARQHREQVPP